MFDIFARVSSTDAGLKAIQEAVNELKSHKVLIGIPEDARARPNGDGVSNAELLFIHTNGSPIRGIPARPVLEPAIEHDKERVAEMLKKAIDAAVDGNKEGVMPALERAGQYGEDIAKKWFVNGANGWRKNSDATSARKGSSRPLIDTEEMRKSITHVVREV